MASPWSSPIFATSGTSLADREQRGGSPRRLFACVARLTCVGSSGLVHDLAVAGTGRDGIGRRQIRIDGVGAGPPQLESDASVVGIDDVVAAAGAEPVAAQPPVNVSLAGPPVSVHRRRRRSA